MRILLSAPSLLSPTTILAKMGGTSAFSQICLDNEWSQDTQTLHFHPFEFGRRNRRTEICWNQWWNLAGIWIRRSQSRRQVKGECEGKLGMHGMIRNKHLYCIISRCWQFIIHTLCGYYLTAACIHPFALLVAQFCPLKYFVAWLFANILSHILVKNTREGSYISWSHDTKRTRAYD